MRREMNPSCLLWLLAGLLLPLAMLAFFMRDPDPEIKAMAWTSHGRLVKIYRNGEIK